MARSGTKSRPGLTLLALAVILALLFGWIAFGTTQKKEPAAWTPKLGIDLEGGTEIILEPQGTGTGAKPTADQLSEAVNIIRQRVNGSGISEAQVSTQGSSNIVVRLPGKNPDQQTLDLVKQSAELNFRAVLVTGAGQSVPVATATPSAGATGAAATPSPSKSAVVSTPEATKKANSRVAPAAFAPHAAATTGSSGSSTADPSAQASIDPDVLASLAAQQSASSGTVTDQNSSENSAAAGTGSDLKLLDTVTVSPVTGKKQTIAEQFEALTCSKPELVKLQKAAGSLDPKLPAVSCTQDGSAKVAMGPVEVRGSEIKSASSGLGTNSQGFSTGVWEVQLNFKSAGTKQFADVTTRLAKLSGDQNSFAIVLDGLVVSYPGVNERIPTGQAQISGSFTQATAGSLAQQLKFGALPISFAEKSDLQISALLGSTQLQHGLLAGLIGLILVVLYSLAQYRALGLVTVFSLVFAGAVTYGLVLLLSWQNGYRLSLAGVAGLIVSIGITADSFIVYFERVRDEVREGRPLRTAVEAGWGRARRTIIISDTVNFIAALTLYILAVGDVRGFAFTLGLTTLVDLLIVFMFTKPAVTLLSRSAFFDGGHPLSGFSAEQLGRAPAYAGRGRVRTPSAAGPSIAERRAAQTSGQPAGTDDDADSLASSRRNS